MTDANDIHRDRGEDGLRDAFDKARRTHRGNSAHEPAPIRFKETKVKDLNWRTQTDYLVKGLFPRRGLAIVWGPPKCGKSFWALDVFLRVALGWPYRGRRVHQHHTAYFALEGQDGFDDRIAGFKVKFLKPGDDVPFFHLFKATLSLVKDHQEMIKDIKTQKIAPACVVIDTLNRSLNGSESKDEDMAAYLAAAKALEDAFKCLVVIIHHCGINETRPRGHTSQTGAADVQIAVKKDEATRIFSVTVEHAKDMPEGATFSSRLTVVDGPPDQDGDPVTSCVVEEVEGDAVPSPKTKAAKIPKSVAPARRALVEALDCLGAVPPASNYIPPKTKTVTIHQWRDYAYRRGISTGEERAKQKAFTTASEHLVSTQEIGIWGDQVWRTR